MALVWKYFDKKANEKAECNYNKCGTQLSYKGGSTGSLIKHLRMVHKLNEEFPVNKRSVSESSGSKEDVNVQDPKRKTQQPITSFLKRQSMQEMIAKMLAIDGFSANSIRGSEYIRSSMTLRGLQLPQSSTSIMDSMHQFYDVAKLNTVKEINAICGSKFSATLDEWTSMKNVRYLNVNIHGVDAAIFNLGLIRILGECLAKNIKHFFIGKLNYFNSNAVIFYITNFRQMFSRNIKRDVY